MNTSLENRSFKPWNDLTGVRELADIVSNITDLTSLEKQVTAGGSQEKKDLVSAQLKRFRDLHDLRTVLDESMHMHTLREQEYSQAQAQKDQVVLAKLDQEIGTLEDKIRQLKGTMTEIESSIEGLKGNIFGIQREIQINQPQIDMISQEYNTPAQSSPAEHIITPVPASPIESPVVQTLNTVTIENNKIEQRKQLDMAIETARSEYLATVRYREEMKRLKRPPTIADYDLEDARYKKYLSLKTQRVNLYSPDEMDPSKTVVTTDPKTGKKVTIETSMWETLVTDEIQALNAERVRKNINEGRRSKFINALDKVNKVLGIPGQLTAAGLMKMGMSEENAQKLAPWVSRATLAAAGAATGGLGLLGTGMVITKALATGAVVGTAVNVLDTHIIKPVYHDAEQSDVVKSMENKRVYSQTDLERTEKLEQERINGSRAVVRNTIKATAALGLGSMLGSWFKSSPAHKESAAPQNTPTTTQITQNFYNTPGQPGEHITYNNTYYQEAHGQGYSTEHSIESATTTSTGEMSAAEQAEIFKSIQEYEQIKHSLTPEQRAQYDQGFEAAKMRLSPEQQSLLNKTQSTTVIEKTEPITAKGAVYHTVDPHQVELEKLKIQLSREAVAADLEAKKIMAQAQVKSAAYGAGGNLLGKVADFFIVKELQNNQAPIYANSPITGSVYGNITPSSPISPVITTHPHAGLINNPAPLYQGDPITTGGSYGHHGIGNTGTVDGVIRTGSGQVYDYSKDVNPISTNSGNPTPPAATNTTVIG